MIKYIWSRIFGRCIVQCEKKDAGKFIDILREGGFTTDPVRKEGEIYYVTLPESKSGLFMKLAGDAEIDCQIRRLPGIPMLFYRYKKRPGIIIGAALFFFIIWLSGRVIWDFDITGNKMISDIEIISALESLGCGPGAYIPGIDFDMVQNDCLIDSENLAWVSVNMDGNLARVEVREKRVLPMEFVPVKGRFANIVAAEDGIIELCRVKRGKAAVEQGDVVKKGELLISGVIDVKERDVRYEYADGEVMAKVYREVESYVPYSMTTQVPTGEKKTNLSIKIFGKVINLSPRGRIGYDLYGKIIEDEKLSLPFGITLPIRLKKEIYSEMTEQVKTCSETEALALAREDAAAKLSEMAEDLQVLSVQEINTADETGVKVTLCIYGVADISANYGFSAAGGDTQKEEDKALNEKNDNG